MELIVGFIVAVTGLIGGIWAIVKYYDQKSTKKQEQQNQQELARDNVLKDIKKDLKIILDDNAQRKEEIKELKEDVNKLHVQKDEMQRQLQIMQETMNENEMDRLRNDIIDGVSKLRNGYDMSQVDLDHIHHCYDKYISKGGNSYIRTCMEYVKEYERECFDAGIEGFDNP
jgi:hypothetical protein